MVSYDCTVSDTFRSSSTVWQGSSFNCSSGLSVANNRISLPHVDFVNGAGGTCGDLSVISTGVNGVEYVSRLTLTATAELNGRTLECTMGGVNEVGNDTIKTGGKVRIKRSQ